MINKYLPIAESCFVVIALMLYSSGLLQVILSGGAGEGVGAEVFPDPVDYTLQQNIFFLTYVISFFLLAIRWKKALYTLSKDRTIWLLLAIAFVSVIWSSNPKNTLLRSIALIGTSLFGLYLASRYTIREQLKLLGWSCALIIGLSILFAIVIPHYGTMDSGIHAGSWRGIYIHKNILGKIMGLGGVVFVLLAIDSKEDRWFPIAGLALSCCLIVLSRSSSSMINFAATIALIPVCAMFRWRYTVMVPAIIAVVLFGGGLSLWLDRNATILLGSIGKDLTLTGRTRMWPAIMEMIWRQPLQGYGYNGFWFNWDSPGAYVWAASNWTPPNAHNGFMDLWLDFGLMGVVVFAISFLQTLWRGLKLLRVDRHAASSWSLLYLIYLVLGNLTESCLINRNDIFWLLYIAISFSLATVPMVKVDSAPVLSES